MQLFNEKLQKLMPIITPLSVLIGILFSEILSMYIYLVPWIFGFMTLAGSLNSSFSDLNKVIKNPLPMLVCLLILHLIMPLMAFFIGDFVFHEQPLLKIGLILAFIIPTGITSLIWVSVNKGNVILTLSIILVDTLLSPFIVPSILQLFVGIAVEMNGTEIMIGLLWMVVLPSIIGMFLNQMTKGKVQETLGPNLSPFSKLGLGAVVALNSSAIAPYLQDLNWEIVMIGVVVFIMAIVGYALGWIAPVFLKANQSTLVSLTYNSGMRNISAGAVIAITYFEPLAALPVIICMLFQQILASLNGILVQRYIAFPQKKSGIITNDA